MTEYFIRWRNKETGAMGQGEPLALNEAKAWVDTLNEKHPDIHHWLTKKVGRKSIDENDKLLKRSITAPLYYWLLARKLGKGCASKGWRELVEDYLKNHPDEDMPFTDELEDDEGIIPFMGEPMHGNERGVDHKLD